MSEDFLTEEGDEAIRHQCPECAKSFDVTGNKWQRDGLICPFCGAEIEEA